MKELLVLVWVSVLVLSLAACAGNTAEPTAVPAVTLGASSATATRTDANTPVATSTISVEYDSDDLVSSTNSSDTPTIELRGDSIAFDGSGATVNGSTITITAAATYRISGTLDDGQIIVDTQDKETVVLVLDGAEIACSTSAPIYVMNADKAVITLADGTENAITDGEAYILTDAESDEPNAAIFARDDLTINGNGSLTVRANYSNGIASKDDLKITGGTITVVAVNDGIKGRDSIAVRDGTVIVDAGADGLQSNNDEDPEKGYILIEGGTLDITAGLDGIQAEAKLAITGGEIAVSSGGGSANSSSSGNWGNWGGPAANTSTGESAKGLKAGVDITIGGDAVIDIDSSDDALHSNDSLTIDGGALSLSSGDDGIHADATLTINSGVVSIAQSYEGIETAEDQELLTFAPSKAYQSIVFSSPELGNGANLVVYAGGRSTGTVTDGLYAGGTYTAGTQVTSLTITSIVTGGGATMGGFPGGPGGMRSPGGGRR